MSQTAPSHSPLEEVADFFARGPSLAEIAQFRLSDVVLAWISELLEREDEGSLSVEEKHQLDELLTINDLVTMIRSRVNSPNSPASASGGLS